MELVKRNTIAPVTLAALEANTAQAFAWDENDLKATVVIQASTATTLTVKAGNGIQGTTDMTVDVPQGVCLLKLESGRFKNVSGENKGKIVLLSPGTPSVGIVALA